MITISQLVFRELEALRLFCIESSENIIDLFTIYEMIQLVVLRINPCSFRKSLTI